MCLPNMFYTMEIITLKIVYNRNSLKNRQAHSDRHVEVKAVHITLNHTINMLKT